MNKFWQSKVKAENTEFIAVNAEQSSRIWVLPCRTNCLMAFHQLHHQPKKLALCGASRPSQIVKSLLFANS